MVSIDLKGKNMLRLLKLLLALITLLMAGTLLAQSPKVEEPLDLASFHEEFDKVDCKDCHGVPDPKVMPPEESLRMANQKCMDCHGTARPRHCNLGELALPRPALNLADICGPDAIAIHGQKIG